MASYFDEHPCENTHEQDYISLVRMLLREDFDFFQQYLGGEQLAPPASKSVVEKLLSTEVERLEDDVSCPICLSPLDEVTDAVEMPCKHFFHKSCLLPWLQKTNSCPKCRYELVTDDVDYEERKKRKEERREREFRVEQLHDSMFG